MENVYPKESGLLKLDRKIAFDRSEKASVAISDSFEFVGDKNEIVENIILLRRPEISDNGITLFSESGKPLKLIIDADSYETNLVSKSSAGSRVLQSSWGEGAELRKLEIKLSCGKAAEFKFEIKK